MKYAKLHRTALAAMFLALAGFALLGLARPAAAGDQVPFSGSLDGMVTVTPINPPVVAVLVEGTGQATHLGQYTVSIPHIVDRGTRTAVGTYVFTAANGDMVFADFTGQSAPTATPGVISITEVATITGGTGRFTNATGSFTMVRLYDTIAGTTAGSFEGTISSPGANKH